MSLSFHPLRGDAPPRPLSQSFSDVQLRELANRLGTAVMCIRHSLGVARESGVGPFVLPVNEDCPDVAAAVAWLEAFASDCKAFVRTPMTPEEIAERKADVDEMRRANPEMPPAVLTEILRNPKTIKERRNAKIRELRAKGLGPREIGLRVGVSAGGVRDVLKPRRKHVS